MTSQAGSDPVWGSDPVAPVVPAAGRAVGAPDLQPHGRRRRRVVAGGVVPGVVGGGSHRRP